jgi:hypothetical protein
LSAHSRAERYGVPVDGVALEKCNDKFDGGAKGFTKGCIGKLEARENVLKPETVCAVTGDLMALADKIDTFVDDIVREIDPMPTGPSHCNAGKKTCVSKKVRCLLELHQRGARKGVALDSQAIQKCKNQFDGGAKGFAKGCIGKLEVKVNAAKPKTICSVTGNAGTLDGKIESFVIDVVTEIRTSH